MARAADGDHRLNGGHDLTDVSYIGRSQVLILWSLIDLSTQRLEVLPEEFAEGIVHLVRVVVRPRPLDLVSGPRGHGGRLETAQHLLVELLQVCHVQRPNAEEGRPMIGDGVRSLAAVGNDPVDPSVRPDRPAGPRPPPPWRKQ